jgi:hypothetical protein
VSGSPHQILPVDAGRTHPSSRPQPGTAAVNRCRRARRMTSTPLHQPGLPLLYAVRHVPPPDTGVEHLDRPPVSLDRPARPASPGACRGRAAGRSPNGDHDARYPRRPGAYRAARTRPPGTTKKRHSPDAWHPAYRHDIAVCELAIGGRSSTVAVAGGTRDAADPRGTRSDRGRSPCARSPAPREMRRALRSHGKPTFDGLAGRG